MIEIKKVLELEDSDYYETHLSLINCIIPKDHRMTPMEIKVLATFMSLQGDIAEIRFGTSGRKIVMNTLNISAQGLSGYIGTLLDKKLIVGRGDKTTILPLLIPERSKQDYRFRLKNNTFIKHESDSKTNMLSEASVLQQ